VPYLTIENQKTEESTAMR